MQSTAERIKERYSGLKALRAPWEALWCEIAKYIFPRRMPGLGGTIEAPGTANDVILFDNTAVQANITLANGQLAWMSPMETPWYAFTTEGTDDGRRFLSKATRQAQKAMSDGRVYQALHECYLDRGAFGVCCLYVEPGRKRALNAQCWPVGTFVFDEDDEGDVDTVIREFTLTPRQAVKKFGADKVHAKTREAVEKGGPKADEREKYLHAIYPRDDGERDKAKLDARNMEIASVYMHDGTGHVCSESGYEEMPVFVSRFLSWGSATGCLYGWSPAFSALPEARQVNFLQKMMDALGEKMAFPPVLAPEELEGEIDANAFGVTYFSKDLAATPPKEWMTAGRYDIGLERIRERQKAIEKAFGVDIFQMFAQIDKQMTAREVAERSAEKITNASPSFARLTSELLTPFLQRVFGIMLRGGKFGQVPDSLKVDAGNGMDYIAPPDVEFSSRMALAVRALPAIGYQRTLERLATVAQLAPEVLDNYDFDKAERDTALADGVSEEFLRPVAERDKMRKARAAAQEQAAKQQAMMEEAEMLQKAGSVKSDSLAAKALQPAA